MSQVELAADVINRLRQRGLKLAIAESLTGGQISSSIVSVAGASDVFLGAVVAYATAAKTGMLGVSPSLLEARGAVDADVAIEMAKGVALRFAQSCDLGAEIVVGLASTGVAGPSEQDGQAPGTVFLAACLGESIHAQQFDFKGDRAQVRDAASEAALNLVQSLLR